MLLIQIETRLCTFSSRQVISRVAKCEGDTSFLPFLSFLPPTMHSLRNCDSRHSSERAGTTGQLCEMAKAYRKSCERKQFAEPKKIRSSNLPVETGEETGMKGVE